MKKIITVCVLFALLALAMWGHHEEFSAKAQPEHRWASDLAECNWQGSSRFSCRGNLNVINVLYDCTPAPPKDPRTQAEKEADAKSGIVWSGTTWLQPTCKMAVLDWCIEHGETRVIKENKAQ